MPKLTLSDITSRGIAALNSNFQAISEYLDNVLSLNGDSPNQMEADLDMNSNDILNAKSVSTDALILDGKNVVPDDLAFAGISIETQTATADQTVFTLSSLTYVPGSNNLAVFLQGTKQAPGSYTETSEDTITFTEGLDEGDLVEFMVFATQEILVSGSSILSTETVITPTDGQTDFTVTNCHLPSRKLTVYINGVRQARSNYSITPDTVTMSVGLTPLDEFVAELDYIA